MKRKAEADRERIIIGPEKRSREKKHTKKEEGGMRRNILASITILPKVDIMDKCAHTHAHTHTLIR